MANDRHLEDVGPAGHEACQRAKIPAGVLPEGSGDRVPHGHFAKCAHHHEHGRAADHVGEQHGGAGFLDGRRRTVEQAGADGGAQRHEADVADVEAAVQNGFDGGSDGSSDCGAPGSDGGAFGGRAVSGCAVRRRRFGCCLGLLHANTFSSLGGGSLSSRPCSEEL